MPYEFKHVVPALPGYFVLDPSRDENDKWCWDKYPVIAWGVFYDPGHHEPFGSESLYRLHLNSGKK